MTYTPQRMRVTFARVVVKATFRWTDEAGKKKQVTKVFEQTVNPFNKNRFGEVKSAQEIRVELNAQRDLWLLKRHNDHRDKRAAA